MISEPMPILSIILHVVAMIALVAAIGIIVSGGVEYLAGYVAGWWA